MKSQLQNSAVPTTPAEGEHELYSVSIVTDQGQGPFRLGQKVQFSCVVDPTPPEPVTYQWKTVDVFYGRTYTQQAFNVTYQYYLPYCYYFCQVLINGTLIIGSASKLVELQGESISIALY